jgi:hypothetical protein
METTPPKISVPKWLQPGVRKVTVLGGPMAFVLLASVGFLAFGLMTAPQWTGFVLSVLMWGGGIFAGANVIEHGIKTFAELAKK